MALTGIFSDEFTSVVVVKTISQALVKANALPSWSLNLYDCAGV